MYNPITMSSALPPNYRMPLLGVWLLVDCGGCPKLGIFVYRLNFIKKIVLIIIEIIQMLLETQKKYVREQ